MKIIPLNRDTLKNDIDCINRLKPDSEREFGILDARGMMRHLRWTFEVSVGTPEAENLTNPIGRKLVWLLFFNWLTNWPGGKIKGPPFATPESENDFE